MRDGKWVATEPKEELSTDSLIRMMVGRELKERYPQRNVTPGEVVLKVENLATLTPALKDVNFELRKGEILGIAGLVGAGRTEVLETLFGIREKGAGKIIYKGKEIQNRTPREAMEHGFAMLTEERRKDGIFIKKSFKEKFSPTRVFLIFSTFVPSHYMYLAEASIISN
mgnify:CR=1 FL=1